MEVVPAGADLWGRKRWADIPCRYFGQEFPGGVLGANQFKRFTQSVDILGGGNISTVDAVTFDLRNVVVDPAGPVLLSDELLDENIEGRNINVYLAPNVPNLLRNGGFEYAIFDDFENWTELATGGAITAETTITKDHETSCKMAAGASAVSMTSAEFSLVRGQAMQLDLWLRGDSGGGGEQVNVYLKRTDGPVYFNFTTRTWGSSSSYAHTMAAPQTWERLQLSIGADELGMSAIIKTKTYQLVIEAAAGDTIYADSSQVLPYLTGTPIGKGSPFVGREPYYYPNAMDLWEEDAVKVYSGEVVSWEWDDSTIRVKTRARSAKLLKDIPTTLINAQASSSWDIPADVEGKPFPMTYGALEGVEGTLPVTFEKALVLAHGRLVNWDTNATLVRAYFDRPGMKLRRIGRVHSYLEDSGYYAPEMLDDNPAPEFVSLEWTKDAANATIYETTGNGYLVGGRLAITFYQKGRSLFYNNNWVNPLQAIDNGILSAASWGSVGSASVQYHPHIIQVTDSELLGAYALVSSALTEVGSSAVYVLIHRSIVAKTDRYYIQNVLVQNTSSFVVNIPWDTKNNPETTYPVILDAITQRLSFWLGGEFRFGCLATHDNAASAVNLYEIGLRIDFAVDLMAADLAADIEGREYQDTWDSRRVAGLLIENPADLVESVYRDELGLGLDDFDAVSHNAFYIERAGVQVGAGQVWEVAPAEQVLEDMALCFNAVIFENLGGKLAIKKLERDVATSTLPVLRRGDFKLDSLKVGRTPRESVVTEFIFHYGRRPSVDDYFKSCFVNRTTQDVGKPALPAVCAAAYAEIGNEEQRREFFLPWLTSDLSTYALAEALVYWLACRRYKIKGALGFEHLGREIGDQFAIELPGYLPKAHYVDAQVVLVKKTIRKSERLLDVELLEIKGP